MKARDHEPASSLLSATSSICPGGSDEESAQHKAFYCCHVRSDPAIEHAQSEKASVSISSSTPPRTVHSLFELAMA